MRRRRRRNKYDKYGIYEIPNYSPRKGKRRKKKKTSLAGVVKTFLLLWGIILLIYIVSYGVKYSMKDEAVSLYSEGDYPGAVDLFEEALKPRLPFLNKFDNDIRYYMADCYVNMKEFDLACHQYDMIKLWSDDTEEKADYYENIAYGLLLYNWKDYRQALPILEKAYEDGYGDLVLYVGSCYGQLGDLENMQLYYNVFLQNHELNSFMYAQYASIALDENEMEKALNYIEEGKKLSDQSCIREILFDEIVYYEKLKDYNTAYQKVTDFMSKYPNDAEGRNELDILYTRQSIDKK